MITKAKELFRCKIWVGNNKDIIRFVQKKLFELGFTWNSNKEYETYTGGYYLYGNDGLRIYRNPSRTSFENHKHKEIKLKKLISEKELNYYKL